jgi:primosomal protein N' (replication factor Y)
MLALCDHVLQQGKTVLFLVPEIALTGQSARILFSRYGEKVAILHSALSEGERRDTYVSIGRGEKPIVLGTRSAVFAPVRNLGLILIDEEQDGSYKSDTGLKYHARDVARFRCAKNNALMLLASATPDIESYYKAESGVYTLVSLTERYGNATLPQVQVVDLRPEKRQNPALMIGSRLCEEIAKNLDRHVKSIDNALQRVKHKLEKLIRERNQ